jgi:hypothetical protein
MSVSLKWRNISAMPTGMQIWDHKKTKKQKQKQKTKLPTKRYNAACNAISKHTSLPLTQISIFTYPKVECAY